MPIYLPYAAWSALRREGNTALRNEWLAAGLNHGAGEVACIKNLIINGLPELNAAWKRILQKHNLYASVVGAICHPIPQVSYPNAARGCELGDLLIVHDHFHQDGTQERRACIMQAKIFDCYGIKSRNDIQKYLYQNWPEFTYTRWPGGLARLQGMLHQYAGIPSSTVGSLSRRLNCTVPIGRTASRDEVDVGCRYAMIDVINMEWNYPFQSSPWRVCSANVGNLYTHVRGPTLPGYLLRMMSGDAGRDVPQISWPRNLGSACHWSLMVNELMHALPLHGGAPIALGGAPHFIAGDPATGDPGTEPEEPERVFSVISITTSGSASLPDRIDRIKEG